MHMLIIFPFLVIIESDREKVDPFVKVLCVFEYNGKD